MAPDSDRPLSEETVLRYLLFGSLITGQNFAMINLILQSTPPANPGWIVAFTCLTIFFTALIFRRFR